MKKRIHLSKSLDEAKNYPSQIDTFRKGNPNKNIKIVSSKSNKTSASSFMILPENSRKYLEKSFNQGLPPSNFLEEMYLKYSKNLQKYFLKNQTGLKLAGNKYFKNLTVEDYMKQNNLTQDEFIHLLNGLQPMSNPLFNYQHEINKDNFFLTPMPNKSRQLLETSKEKNDFLNAERSAVVMRTFEYTHGIKSKVGIRELKKIIFEQKQRLINLMLASASKIQRWWKKKYLLINKNKANEKYDKKILYYNYMLNKKKAKIFLEKIKAVFKKKKKPKFIIFLKKLNSKAKNSGKKFFSYLDWVKNMKICSQIIKFNLIKSKFPLIKKNHDFINNFFITKKSFINQNNNLKNGINNELSQIRKIIFLQKAFRQYIKIKKGKQNLRKFSNSNNSQFSYFSPNKMFFLFNKNINSEGKEIKSISKNNINPSVKKKGNLAMLSPISKNVNENDDELYNDNINNEANYNKKGIIERNDDKKLLKSKTTSGNYNIEIRSNINDNINKRPNNRNIPIKKIFPNKKNTKNTNNREANLKPSKQNKLTFNNNIQSRQAINPKSNKNKKIQNAKLFYNNNPNNININNNYNTQSETNKNNLENKIQYNSNSFKNNFPSKKKMSKIPQKITLKNSLLKIEENELSLITTTNNNNNNNTSQNNNNNNLLLIDSLELEKEKKIDRKIINAINSNNEENENLENSIPPELNMDNYQQDSTLDFRDKRIIKSNQKTISTSAILHLDTSDNHILINNQFYHESNYPLQFLGQICLNYLHRPLIINKNSYIGKTVKKIFASEIKDKLNKVVNIKNNFTFEKKLALNKTYFLQIFFKKWKFVTNKTSPPYVYSKIITSICTTDNSEKNNFSYYCRINKSSEENDFLFLRITLGYKLLRRIFCLNDIKKFLYLLKRRRRRNFRAKTVNFGYYSKNVFNLLEFKIKLPVVLNKILIKKYFGIFFHKFLLFAMNLEKNEEFGINNNKCKLIIEGYRKGYFGIFYNILSFKMSQPYFNTGLKLSNFIQELLRMK